MRASMSAVADETDDINAELPTLPQAQGEGAAEPSYVEPKLTATTARHAIIFDIETGPLPPERLWQVVPPFDPESIKPFPPFDPSAVKTGNLKDAAKIAEKIAAAEQQHAFDAAAHAAKSATAKQDYEAAVIDKAALDPLTGQVLAIGYLFTKEGYTDVEYQHAKCSEIDLLAGFWDYVSAAGDCCFVGHNTHGFDLPFLVRRSWLLGVPVAAGVLEQGRFFNPLFVDTMRVWACGVGGSAGMVALDKLAGAFGVGRKNGDGALFSKVFSENVDQALCYLRNDLHMTHGVARKLKLIQ